MTIVFIHGALGCAHDFDACIQALQAKGFNCRCLELSGHGSTAFADNFSIEQFAIELQSALENLSPTNTLLFGYSMGGYVILSYLSKNKQINFPFMTLATKWHWTQEIAQREKILCNKAFLLEKAAAYYQALQHKHANCDRLLEQTAGLIESLGTAVKPDLAGLLTKGKIMRGSLDKMVSEEESLALTAQLANAEFETLPQVKHPFDTVDTDLLVEKITSFAQQVLSAE